MSGARLLSEHAYRRLKAATAEALRATPDGSAAAFAPRTRVNERTLRLYADHSSELFAPLDVVADLEAATAEPVLARVLADLSGCVLRRKHVDGETSALAAIKETGEATAAIAALALSGAWGLDEVRAARAAVNDALVALASLDAALDARLSGRKKP